MNRHLTLAAVFAANMPAALAGPEGGVVAGGAGAITQSGSGTTTITQTSERLAIDWQSFNVLTNETVRFEQPSAQSAALNRIFDQNPSVILGALDANGHVYLINPNGVIFGESARIDVGALIASSLDLPLDAFFGGQYDFAALDGAAGPVVNRGLITAATGGSVTLLGGSVANEGLIVADFGQVNLGAGNHASLDFDGYGLLYFEIDEAVLESTAGENSAVRNSGTIRADGGQVLLTARAARNVFDNVVNNEGVIRAARIDNSGGVVRLLGTGANVITTGSIDARGAGAADAGGTVQVLGDRVGVLEGASIDVSGADGGTILIGGARHGGTAVASAFAVVGNAALTADARTNGDGGDIVVWADVGTWFDGSASATGGMMGGDGGFVEISGKQSLVFGGSVDTGAPNGRLGTLLFDPGSITIIDGDNGNDDNDLPDLSNAGTGDTTSAFEISEEALERLASSSNIVLEAAGDIVMQDLASDVLGLGISGADGGALTISADTDADGAGAFSMNAGDTIRTEGGAVTISAAGLSIGGIDITGASGVGVGAVTLSSTAGATIAGDLAAGGGVIDVGIDADDNEAATLRVEGTLTAATATLRGSAAGNDTLEGDPNGADAFVLNAANAGTLNGAAFQGFGIASGLGGDDTFRLAASFAGTVSGGAGDDTFAMGDGGSAGAIDGGAGTDAQTYAGLTGPFTVTLGGSTSIENLIGSNAGDTLVGTAAADAFVTTGAYEGVVGGLSFSSFENLHGSGGADSFAILHDVFWVDGGPGNDAFTLGEGASATVTGGDGTDMLAADVALATHFAVPVFNKGSVDNGTGIVSFASVESITGSGASDVFDLRASFGGTFFGGGGDDVFNLSAGNHVEGGDGADVFNLAAGVGAGIDGGGGPDTLVVDLATPMTFEVTSTNGGTLINGVRSVTFTAVENLSGSAQADTFRIAARLDGVAAAGAGNDMFVLRPGASGALDGGAGADEVQGANSATTFVTDGLDSLTATRGADVVVLAAVESVHGGFADNTFRLVNDFGGAISGGSGNDVFEIRTNVTGTLTGEGGDDRYVLADGVVVSGTLLRGGQGKDTLDLSALAGASAVVLQGINSIRGFDGQVPGVARFEGIEDVIAGMTAGSSLTGVRTGTPTWVLGSSGGSYSQFQHFAALQTLTFTGFDVFNGGELTDTFLVQAGTRAGDLTLTGGGGADIAAFNGVVTVAGRVTIADMALRGGGTLTATDLRIDGSWGAGVVNPNDFGDDPLRVNLATLEITRSSGRWLLADQSGDLHVIRAELGDGRARITVNEGDLIVGFIDAGGPGGPFTIPAVGGAIELVADLGSIEADGAAEVNVRAGSATLRAGTNIGEPSDPMTIVVPPTGTITLAGVNAAIDNIGFATVDHSAVTGLYSDHAADAAAASYSVAAAAAASLLEFAVIDWARLDPNVALFECLDPCILLPADRRR